MKKWIIFIIVIAIGGLWAVRFKNNAVGLNEDVKEAWGNVETAYQRRNDLIGNLVNTVKGAADFERTTLTKVIEARAKATSINIDPTNITPEQLAEFNSVQGGLSGALKSLLVTVERYPDLKANQNFLKLQDELTSTENTIQTQRTRYNEAIRPFNEHVNKFPNLLISGAFGYKEKPYFDSEEGADQPVDVGFDYND